MSDRPAVPTSEIGNRIERIQGALQREELEALVVLQPVDLFYFSGTAQKAVLFIPASGPPLLMVRRYFPRARAESPLADMVEIASIREVPECLADRYGRLPRRVAFELDVLPVRDFDFLRRLLGTPEAVDGSHLILELRRIKSDWELRQMAQTADMSGKTFAQMRHILRPGLTEMAFAGMVETFARSLGHGGMLRDRSFPTGAYPWHILSGENGGRVGHLDSPASGSGTSAAFPSGAGHRRLAPDEPIMVDFGSVKAGYHIDETRMFAIGAMPEPARSACRAAIDIHDRLIDRVKPGAVAGDLFDHAVSLARRLGYETAFLGPAGYKVDFIGHGIGLELVEPPFIARNRRDRLAAGMTLALEPKMCFSGAFAAGVESVVQVTETGSRLISRVPVEIVIV